MDTVAVLLPIQVLTEHGRLNLKFTDFGRWLIMTLGLKDRINSGIAVVQFQVHFQKLYKQICAHLLFA